MRRRLWVLFRRWLVQSSSLPPALRDALRARLEFVGLQELSALLETVREDERACTREYAAAHKRWREFTHQKLRPGEDGAEQVFRRELKVVQLADEVDLWGVQARRLQKLGGRLNSVLEHATGVSTEDEFEDG